MKLKLIPLILASAALSGCLEEKAKEPQPASTTATALPAISKQDAVASVNGVFISKKSLEDIEKQVAEHNQDQGQTISKEQLVNELVQRELLVQMAVQKNLDKSPEVLSRLESIKQSILTKAAVDDFLKNTIITDEEIKAEYDSKTANLGSEYKARHILVKTEDQAKKIIAELEKGADFATMAKKYSIDPSSNEGGDLGWFAPDRMVAPFSEAVIPLENGKFTKQPIQTQFGWHIVLREESRSVSAPPLDAVKDQIRSMLLRPKVQAMIENLHKTAKIEIFLPKEAPAPAPAEAKPAEAQPAAAGNEAPAAAAPAAAAPAAPVTPATPATPAPAAAK